MRNSSLFIILVTLATGALASGDMVMFKGLHPDMSVSDAISRYPAFICKPMNQQSQSCIYSPETPGWARLSELDSLGGAQTRSWMLLVDDKGLIDMVVIRLASDQFEQLTGALTGKYGNPSKTSTGLVQNGLGASFDQAQSEWAIGDYRMLAIKRAEKINDMQLVLTSAKRLRKGVEDAAAKRKAGASDF